MGTRNRKQVGYIYKRGGWWCIRYRQRAVKDGERKTVQRSKRLAPVDAHHKTKASVRGLAHDTLEPLNKHQYTPEAVTTLGDFVQRIYLPHVKDQLRESTYRGYRNQWRDYMAPLCKDWWMRDIRTCDVQHLLEEIASQHDLSRTTLRHIKALLSGIFNYGKQQGYFDGVNPVHGVAIPKARAGGETYAYSLEEITHMLKALGKPAATVVALAAYTGLRRSEIQGLLWENYDGHEIRVTRSVWNGIENEPKTEKSKAPVPVIDALARRLDMYRASCGNPASGPMFANGNGKPLCLNNLANRDIQPVFAYCRHCGEKRTDHVNAGHTFELDTSRVIWRGWHGCRRGLATNLYRLGVSDKTIQAILRHANLLTTLSFYVKNVAADSVKAMETLEASLTCAKRAQEASSGQTNRPN